MLGGHISVDVFGGHIRVDGGGGRHICVDVLGWGHISVYV